MFANDAEGWDIAIRLVDRNEHVAPIVAVARRRMNNRSSDEAVLPTMRRRRVVMSRPSGWVVATIERITGNLRHASLIAEIRHLSVNFAVPSNNPAINTARRS
ncbi:hypothetical protein [Mesorhizobium tianshanense]|uniref:hypothetical protein n=1 Tax=Mesorhizobium tianshanense TaxID=39844 RepID=UPI00119CCD15|nr:hypothetical protein [Mesorhizobium tianshanense]